VGARERDFVETRIPQGKNAKRRKEGARSKNCGKGVGRLFRQQEEKRGMSPSGAMTVGRKNDTGCTKGAGRWVGET